jgi:L-ascorbate metabolism protein UlaG (beta-lactamase superfamily)
MNKQRKQSSKGATIVTWLGHSAYHFRSPTGVSVLVDPWLENPKAPPGARESVGADIILITHGHGDHIGNAVEIAKRTGATVVSNYEVSLYLQSAGLSTVEGINKSGTVNLEGINVTMVDATHSSGIEVGGNVLAGGDPAGFIIEFENRFVVYHAGDTGLFGDMKLIAELYRPALVILPIGGYYTMGPREAAKACALMNPKHVIGMHYGTFPILKGTPEEFKNYLPPKLRKRVHILEPGTPAMFF